MTEYEHASIQRLDLILQHELEQTKALMTIRSHTRGVVAAIVFAIGVSVLFVLLSVLR